HPKQGQIGAPNRKADRGPDTDRQEQHRDDPATEHDHAGWQVAFVQLIPDRLGDQARPDQEDKEDNEAYGHKKDVVADRVRKDPREPQGHSSVSACSSAAGAPSAGASSPSAGTAASAAGSSSSTFSSRLWTIFTTSSSGSASTVT